VATAGAGARPADRAAPADHAAPGPARAARRGARCGTAAGARPEPAAAGSAPPAGQAPPVRPASHLAGTELPALLGIHPQQRSSYTGLNFWWWAVTTVLLGLASLGLLGSSPGTSFGGLVGTVLSGLYTRYLYRGDRFRILFW
jgi:hypothetical protein